MAPKFTVSDVDVPAELRRRRLKAAALSVASVLVLVVGGGAAWYFTPPAMPESLDDAQALVNSARFQRLSKEDKRPYMDVIREQFGSLDPNERRKMMEDEAMRDAVRDARGAQMDEMAKRWLVMTPEERAAMQSMWGNRGGGERRQRPERPEGGAASRTHRRRASRTSRSGPHHASATASPTATLKPTRPSANGSANAAVSVKRNNNHPVLARPLAAAVRFQPEPPARKRGG